MLVTMPYRRDRAVEYAKTWAMSRNPLFENYAGIGGDCTNFVSQAIYAGSCVMNYTETFGWYYRSPVSRAPAWTGVEFFYNFFASNEGLGPYATEVSREGVDLGDVVQLADETGDYYHTLIITGFDGEEILVSAHTNDALDRPLSTYDYGSARFLRIEGVRIRVPNRFAPNCFLGLINGRKI
ncbi:MAG: amidase [Ruminococcaceae bacterium]|nr:amidase [Oscillospiraceae bacterium]